MYSPLTECVAPLETILYFSNSFMYIMSSTIVKYNTLHKLFFITLGTCFSEWDNNVPLYNDMPAYILFICMSCLKLK